MTKDVYIGELKKIMVDPVPAKPTTLTRGEIEAAIADISEKLKRPLSNVERLWLIEDRVELRKQLAAISEA